MSVLANRLRDGVVNNEGVGARRTNNVSVLVVFRSRYYSSPSKQASPYPHMPF